MNKVKKLFNISTWRKSGLASNPLFRIPGFFLHFSLELSYGYLRFEGNGKIPLERQGIWRGKEWTLDRNTYILISTHFYHKPRWQNWSRLHSAKGQIISKRFFSGRGFFQKTNKNTSHTSKNELICSFFERFLGLTICFRN